VELELRHLRCLVALADAGNIRDAARALKISDVALGSQLGRIERTIGQPLFARTAGVLTPTARGREILDPARAALAELAELGREARRNGHVALRLAGPRFVVPALAARFAVARSEVPLTTRVTDGGTALDALRAGQADAAVTVHWPHTRWPFAGQGEVRLREIDRTPLQVLLPDTHEQAGAELVDLADLVREPWCVQDQPPLVEALIAECVRHGFEPDIRYKVDTEGAVVDLVASGRAVALVTDPAPVAPGAVARPYRNAGHSELVLVWREPAVPAEVAGSLVTAMEEWHAARTWAAPAAVGAGAPGSPARPLRIGSVTAVATIPVVPRLRTVHGVHAEISVGAQSDLVAAARSGALDLVVADDLAGRVAELPADWSRRTVAREERIAIACGAGHRLARRRVLLEWLAEETWTVRADSGEAELVRALGVLGGFEPRIASTFTDPRQVSAAVASGRLLRLAEPGEPEQGVVRRVVDHPGARRDMLLVWPPDGAADGLADRVAEELRLARAPYTSPYPDDWT
jgi:DNA-binding transcriptional LysR family regulator